MSNIPQDLRELNSYEPQPSQRDKLLAMQKLFGYGGPIPADQSQPAAPQGLGGQFRTGPNQNIGQQFAQQIVGQPTQNVAQGIGQMAAGAGLGLAKFNQQQNAAFPQAPGGAKPSLGTGLANFFTGRNNGGLY